MAWIREQTRKWDQMLDGSRLPAWEEFPELPLYMDQVIYLMNQYLPPLTQEEERQQVTPAMINNYVKLSIIPRPEKKRYARVHLAFLVMVCVLKQTVSTAEIKKLIPVSLGEREIKPLYERFCAVFQSAKDAFRENMNQNAARVFETDGAPLSDLIFRTAAISALSRKWTEQVLSLYPEADEGKAEQPRK